MSALGVAAYISGKLRGRRWRRVAPPAVLPEVVGWVIAFAAAWFINAACDDAEPPVRVVGTYVERCRLAGAASVVAFGLIGGVVAAVRWSPSGAPHRVAVLAVGGAAVLATALAFLISVTGAYLLVSLLPDQFCSVTLCATITGAVGGAAGGSIGENALWLGIGQTDL
jgi:hypothetical protein